MLLPCPSTPGPSAPRRRAVTLVAALALLVGTTAAGGPVLADDGDAGVSATVSETTSVETATSSTPGTVSPTTPPATSTAPPPTSAVTDGILSMRTVDTATGRQIVDVPASVLGTERAETRMPAQMLLPAGRYRIEILAIPTGYRLVSSWAFEVDVVGRSTVEVVFEMTPVSATPRDDGRGHGRVPIQSIPSGRTR